MQDIFLIPNPSLEILNTHEALEQIDGTLKINVCGCAGENKHARRFYSSWYPQGRVSNRARI